MQVYSIGPNDFVESIGFDDELDTSKLLWMIIWYFEAHFEGYGELAAMGADGMLRCYNISHCHGMDPVQNWAEDAIVVSVGEFVEGGVKLSGIAEANDPLRDAVRLMAAGKAPNVVPREM